jgi:hypothetical protein
MLVIESLAIRLVLAGLLLAIPVAIVIHARRSARHAGRPAWASMLGPAVACDMQPTVDALKTMSEPVNTLVWRVEPTAAGTWWIDYAPAPLGLLYGLHPRLVGVHRLDGYGALQSTYRVRMASTMFAGALSGAFVVVVSGLPIGSVAVALVVFLHAYVPTRMLRRCYANDVATAHRELALRLAVQVPRSDA